ncbi:MAG: helical backbone metal receptor [Rhodospirillaceae bacterium]|nr:helical backbone metal receptor [Rhodospirillaceae bacterium]
MAETAGPLLEDDAGNRFAPAGPAARIACFVPSITELLVDLGLGERLVARTRFCIHPADAVARIPAIGGTKKVSLRKLEALAPTHAVLNIDENTVEMAEAMRALVPNVVVTHPLAPEDNLRLYALMGGLFGRAAEAAALSRQFRAARDALPPADPAGRRDVLYFIWKEPWMTVSRDTYISAMLGLVGWRTTHHDPGVRYPTVDLTPETVAATDLFLFPTEPWDFTRADIDAFLRDYDCPPEKALPVDGEYCSWYGSRAIAGLRYLKDLAQTERTRG